MLALAIPDVNPPSIVNTELRVYVYVPTGTVKTELYTVVLPPLGFVTAVCPKPEISNNA